MLFGIITVPVKTHAPVCMLTTFYFESLLPVKKVVAGGFFPQSWLWHQAAHLESIFGSVVRLVLLYSFIRCTLIVSNSNAKITNCNTEHWLFNRGFTRVSIF